MTPLYGHFSQETAYIIEDYPYGVRLRCKRRCWIERHPKRGWRFCYQTTNPKAKIETWNKPKFSTYNEIAACMWLDDSGHVQWAGIGGFSTPEQILAFVQDFPQADMHELSAFVIAKLQFAKKQLSGEVVFTVNGVKQPLKDHEKARIEKEIETLRQASSLLFDASKVQT